MAGDGRPHESADRDLVGEAVAGEELERTVQRQLLGVPRWDLAADDHLALDVLDDQVADAAVRVLADSRLDLLSQTRPGSRTIESHGVTLGEDAK